MPFSGKLFGTGQTAKTVPNEDPPDKTEESQTKESQREEEDPQSLRSPEIRVSPENARASGREVPDDAAGQGCFSFKGKRASPPPSPEEKANRPPDEKSGRL
jgi:hypothetical protein